MRLSTQGLADGFLNGFRTMADYQSQQKADARADKSLSLQEQQIKDGNDQWKRSFDHTVEQDKTTNTREDRRLTKQETDADRNYFLNEKQTMSNIANDGARTSASVAASNASVAASKAQTEANQYTLEREKQLQFIEENKGLYLGAYQKIAQGLPITDQEAGILNDSRSGIFNINKYTDTTYVSDAKALQGSVDSILKNYKPDQFHSQELYQQLNSPQIKQQFNTVFKDDIKKNSNYFDSVSGKQVVDKEFAGIVPMKDGSFALEVKPIYADGSSGNPVPVTVNRSNDPNDMVRTIAPADLIGVINSRAKLAYSVGDPNTIMQRVKLADAPDTKGFAEKAAEVDTKTQASISATMKAYQGGAGTDGAKIETRIDEIKAQGEQAKRTLARGYGLSDVAYDQLTGDKGGGNNTQKTLIDSWMSNNPMKQEFYRRGVAAGKIDPQTTDSVELDNAFNTAVKALKDKQTEQQAQSLESAILMRRTQQKDNKPVSMGELLR